jgi:hypothetical protein
MCIARQRNIIPLTPLTSSQSGTFGEFPLVDDLERNVTGNELEKHGLNILLNLIE